jgi:type II secretory pathway pseudopilin PulG
MKDKPQKHFRLQRVSPSRVRGFSLIELILVAGILSFIAGVFFFSMSSGQFTYTLSSARADLQSEVRRAIGWIVKDVRQTVSWDMSNNDPSPSYIKFRQVTGWDYVNNTFSLSDIYIEYIYSSLSHTITRRTSDGVEWTINYVFEEPFYTIDSLGGVVPLNKDDLLTSKQLIVTISGQIHVIGAENTTYSLTEEVQIRNG